MKCSSLFERFSKISPQHAKLFEIFDEIIADNPSLPYGAYLENILYILGNMNETFVERRSSDFFKFLLEKLSDIEIFSNTGTDCKVTFFRHSVTFPFQYKRVIGFFIEFSGIQSEAEELIQSLCRHHQEVLLIKNSVLILIKSQKNRTALYFELQKINDEFSLDEIQDLKERIEEIGTYMTTRWRTSIPSLESSAKTLRWLMNEFEKGDLPHVMIALDRQTPEKLRFFAFVCQFIDSDTHPLTKLFTHPDIEIECQFREKIQDNFKEGMVLKIDLPNTPSSLVEKRHQISHFIEKYIGPFRDINGGLLEKIEKNFAALSQMLPGSAKGLREFFDSITPEDKRAICSPSILQEIYSATQNVTSYIFLEKESWVAAIVKIEKGFERAWKEKLVKHIFKIGFSETLTSNAVILSCFLHHPNREEVEILKTETKELFQKWTHKNTGQTLQLCCTSRFTSFDPRTGTEEETSYLHKMLFEGLMRIDSSGKAEPAIAQKIDISEDGMLYRFFLRKSCWSNGMPLTAHDFLYSWKTILTRKDLAPLSYLFDGIKYAQEIKKKEMPLSSLGVNVVDDYTLEVMLRSPCTPFLEICALTLFSPICQAIDEKQPSWTEVEGDEYVCNGPFCLEKKDCNGGVVLKKNPHYWESQKVRLQRVKIPVVSSEEAKKLFLTKQVDALLYYFYKNSSFVDTENLNITRLKGANSKRFLCFNCLEPPFHNKKIRKAIALAINRKEIIQGLPNDMTPSTSFYSSVHSKTSKNEANLRNVEEARKLLIQALAEDPAVRNTFFDQSISALEGNKNLAISLCNHLNEIFSLNWNIAIVKKTDSQGYFKQKRNFQISISGWVDRIHDPGYFLGVFSSADNFANFSCWTHPLIQSIIEEVKVVKDQQKKEQLLKDAENLLFEEIPMIPLIDLEYISLCHAHVQGIHANHLQQFDIRFSFKEQQSILRNK